MIRTLAYHGGTVEEVPVERIAERLNRGTFEAEEAGDFLWLHIEANGEKIEYALGKLALDLPPTVRRALIAVETRPRADLLGDGVLLNLRAPCGEDADEVGISDPLVSIRLWAHAGLLLSVAFRASAIMPEIEARFRSGELHDPGDVIVAIAQATGEAVDPVVATLGDDLDTLESDVGPNTPFALRRRVTQLRSAAITYRRFVNPQRLALDRLATLPLGWLDEGERAAVREAADRFARMSEELESVRERAAVVHEELTDLRAEKIDSRSLQIAIVAMIFLPLTFITGLLGMNVDGIPYAHHPGAFWVVTALCVIIAVLIGLWFLVRGWSRE
jgi:zinc transporter